MNKTLLSLSIATTLLLSACGGNKEKDNATSENTNATVDNCLDFSMSERYQTLDPINITDVPSFHVASQIFEPLFRFDEKNLSLRPLLAESFEVSEDNINITVLLKKGAYFHDNACFAGGKGREIKANDVLYTFQRILNEKSSYAYSSLKDKIAGFENDNLSGVTVADDYTVKFTLVKPSASFMSILATISTSIVSKEAIESNVFIGSGPFVYSKTDDTEKSIKLQRNKNYHMKDKKGVPLPYLSCVSYRYLQPGEKQLDLFMANEIDIIAGLPSEAVKEIVENRIADFQNNPVKYVLGRYPEASTNYLNLNTAKAPFDNIKVRQAIAHAIDKEKIVNNILNGEAADPGNYGIVATSINKYDYSSVIGTEHNIDKAKALLAEAGYPEGKGFPSIELISGKGNTSVRIALEIQKQLLAQLNINVEISSLSLKDKNKSNYHADFDMSMNGWLIELPDPTGFLSLFYGKNVPSDITAKSYPNTSRFKNKEFDKLYEEALGTLNQQQRYELCLQADQIVATQVPCIPLWYHENYHLIQSSVKGYQPNALDIQYLTNVKLVTAPSVETKAH